MTRIPEYKILFARGCESAEIQMNRNTEEGWVLHSYSLTFDDGETVEAAVMVRCKSCRGVGGGLTACYSCKGAGH